MRKKYILGGFLLSLLLLTSCSKDNTPTTVKSLPFHNYNNYYDIKAETLDTYYVGDSLVPYVSVSNYIKSMNGFLDSDKYSCSASPFFSEYVVKTEYSGVPLSIVFDYKNDRILSSYDFAFLNTVNITDTIDYTFNLSTKAKEYYNGKTIIFDLAKYDFDMRYINGNCLVPLQIINALFGGQNYNSTYYTGNSYYNTYFSLAATKNGQEVLQKMKNDTSSNLDNEELRESNYNYLCFLFDYFYGLKETKGIESFDSYIGRDIKNKLLSTNANEYTKGYASIVQKLNELHTSFHNKAYNADISVSFVEGEFETSNFKIHKNTLNDLTEKAKLLYGDELKNQIQIVDNTCYIFFSGFDTGDKAKVKDENGNILNDAYLYDTYYLFYKAIEDIKNNNQIKNIVVDLSINGGGNAGAQYRALGFLTKSFDISSRNALTKLASTSTIKVDTNNDGLYDESDDYSDKYNWYILTSVCSYSSANLFAHLAKKNNSNVKLIGEKAGGGGCSILPVIGIDGTALQISGINQNVTLTGNGTSYNYTILEEGPSVDYELDYNYFYDRNYLTNYINNL